MERSFSDCVIRVVIVGNDPSRYSLVTFKDRPFEIYGIMVDSLELTFLMALLEFNGMHEKAARAACYFRGNPKPIRCTLSQWIPEDQWKNFFYFNRYEIYLVILQAVVFSRGDNEAKRYFEQSESTSACWMSVLTILLPIVSSSSSAE